MVETVPSTDRSAPAPPIATLLDLVDQAAAEDPDVEIVFASQSDPGRIRLSELSRRYRAVAGAFRAASIGHGDVVAVQLPNRVEAIEAYLGAAAVGAVIVPIVHIYGPHETNWILEASGAKLYCCPERWTSIDFAERVAAMPATAKLRVVTVGEHPVGRGSTWGEFLAASTGPVAPCVASADDRLLVLYTSGTTADPKGVVHTHRSLLAELANMPQAPAGRRDWISLMPWPAGHIAGLCAILSALVTRATVVLIDRWDIDAACRLIEEHRPLFFCGAPFHVAQVLDRAEAGAVDSSSVRYAMTGGAGVPPSLVERADALGWRLVRSYGSSEHPTVTAGRFQDPLVVRANTDGPALAGSEIRIVDPTGSDVAAGHDGEILVRGPEQFVGYTDAELNASAFVDGWFRTGDVGRLDSQGRLTITDRLSDIIIRGGENLSSLDIESLVLRHPSVQDSAALGVPDDRYGERVGVAIILATGAAPVDIAEMRRHFESLGAARQKTPEYIAFVDEFPRTPAGKVKKQVLREQIDFRAAANRGGS
jgi:acyl-CoA synthetase (AMP-forming)/AMP-acid ligase II